MKLKPTLLQKLAQEEQKREYYRKNYGIEEEDVVVVEKRSTMKFLITLGLKFVRLLLQAVVFVLAVFGVYCLIEPDIRTMATDLLIRAISQYF